MGEWVVRISLKFESNGFRFFSDLRDEVNQTNAALERFQRMMQGGADTSAMFGRSAAATADVLGRQATAYDAAAAAADRYGLAQRSAAASGRGVAGARPGGGSGGGGDTGMIAGLVAAFAAYSGIKGAGDLQALQAQLGVAGLPKNRMGEMHALALKMSSATAQSEGDSLALLKVMTTAGAPIAKLHGKALQDYAMATARFADVNYLQTGSKHMEFEQSATMLAGLSHDLQIYDPKRQNKFADLLYRAGFQSAHGGEQMGTQMRYYAARAKSAGLSDEDIVNTYPLLDRFGLGTGRGGSGFNMLLKNLQDPRGAKKYKALKEMGVYDSAGNNRFIDKATGNVDMYGPHGFLQYVANWREKMGMDKKGALANQLVSRGFDTNAANVVDMLGSKGGIEQHRRIVDAEKRMPSLEQAQIQLMSGLNNQTKLLTSNFQNLTTETMYPLLPSITKVVSGAAAGLGNMAQWLFSHPPAAAAAGVGLMGAGIWGAKQAISMGHSMLGIGEHSGKGLFARFFLHFNSLGSDAMKKFIETAARGFEGFGGVTNTKLYLPMLNLINKMGPIGQSIASSGLQIGSGIEAVESALSGVLGILAKFGKLGNPVLGLAPFLMSGNMSQDEASVLRAKYLQSRRDYAKKHGGLGSISDSDAQQIRDQDKVIQSVHLHFPNMVIKDGADFAKKVKGGLQGIGSLVTTPTLANPQTVGAGLFR
jgi:TP901 family phage tail tape measure protein